MEFLVFTLKRSCLQQGWLVWNGIHVPDKKERGGDQDQAPLCRTENQNGAALIRDYKFYCTSQKATQLLHIHLMVSLDAHKLTFKDL